MKSNDRRANYTRRFNPKSKKHSAAIYNNTTNPSTPPHPHQSLHHPFKKAFLTDNNVRAGATNANGVLTARSGARSRRALLPRDVELLGECDGRVVVGQLAGQGAVPARERDAVVDVEDAVAAAGRPDGGGGLDAVLLGVDLAVEEGAAALEGGAGGLLSNMSARSPCI
jgi:hypothetical protein